MSIYRPKGSKVWVMDFMFRSQRIRETTGMTSKTRAKEVYEKRKQSLKDGTAGIRRQQRPDLLSTAAEKWQQAKQAKWSSSMISIANYAMAHLLPVMGKRLLVDIEASDIRRYQSARIEEGASGRTVNIEVGCLRQIMRKYGAWARIQADVTMLREREDVGCALTEEQENILLLECGRSASRALLPFVALALETGARFDTIRTLQWGNIDFVTVFFEEGLMKTIAFSAALFLWVSIAQAQTLTASQAKVHVGENATVCGIVASEHTAMSSRGEPTFINLDSPYPDQVFTILVWGDDRKSVGELPRLKSRVCATGMIKDYRGVPEIVVRSSRQFSR